MSGTNGPQTCKCGSAANDGINGPFAKLQIEECTKPEKPTEGSKMPFKFLKLTSAPSIPFDPAEQAGPQQQDGPHRMAGPEKPADSQNSTDCSDRQEEHRISKELPKSEVQIMEVPNGVEDEEIEEQGREKDPRKEGKDNEDRKDAVDQDLKSEAELLKIMKQREEDMEAAKQRFWDLRSRNLKPDDNDEYPRGDDFD